MKKIKLTQGQYALVDDEDFKRVNQFRWFAFWEDDTKSFYAIRNIRKDNGRRTIMRMHRYIMNCPKGKQTDHKNHNTLDNQKSNLRICTRQQNKMNRKNHKKSSSGYKGVYWNIPRNKWMAYIRHNGKLIYLGLYKNEIDAAMAYNKKAKELFRKFAYLNKV